MNPSDALAGALAGLLLLAAAVLAMVQTAFGRLTRLSVEQLARRRPAAGRLVARVVAAPRRAAASLLLTRTVCEVAAAACVTLLLVRLRGSDWTALAAATALTTVAAYLLVAVTGRSLGARWCEAVAARTAAPVLALSALLAPITRALPLAVPESPFASEAELRDLVDQAEESGVVDRRERELINSVFELGDTIVREVMVPRPDVVFIERGKTVRQALTLALRSGFSRVPVSGENEDDVVGIAYLKDLTRRYVDGHADDPVGDTARAAAFVPDSKPVDELLREMQADRTHLAIVVDEYGGTAGLVTIEDILEEIVGEIADEYDRERAAVETLPDGRVRVTARLPVEDLGELFDIDLTDGHVDTDGVDTVGGLLASALGRVPIPGATARVAGLALTAESATGRRHRIGTVLVSREADAVPAGAPSATAEDKGEPR